MLVDDTALAGACLLSGAGWSALAARRAPGGSTPAALRALAGGGAAFGIALAAYALLSAAGLEVRWESVLGGGWRAAAAALAIGLVEEGAKLAGLALAVVGPGRPGVVLRASVGVAAGFAVLEAAIALHGAPPPLAAARALLAPAAHAVLAAPSSLALVAVARGTLRRRWLAAGGLAAAVLHAACDLSLAAPRLGRIGYAAALLVPALGMFVVARRRLRARAPAIP